MINIKYHELVSEMVKKSGYTLREIAEKCEQFGVKVNPSYISKLQSSSQAPASDEINIALSKVCRENPDLLIYASYKEKAPDIIGNFLDSIIESLKTQIINAQSLLNLNNKELDKYIETVEKMTALDIIRDFLKSQEFEKSNENSDDDEININDILSQLGNNLVETIVQSDDSMSPIIPKDSLLHLEDIQYLKSGDIVVCRLLDESLLIRRYIEVEGEIFLISESSLFPPIRFVPTQMLLIGKVNEITIKI